MQTLHTDWEKSSSGESSYTGILQCEIKDNEVETSAECFDNCQLEDLTYGNNDLRVSGLPYCTTSALSHCALRVVSTMALVIWVPSDLTDGRTNGRTFVNVELLSQLKINYLAVARCVH